MLADGREGSVTMEAEGNAGKHVEKNTGKERNNEAHADWQEEKSQGREMETVFDGWRKGEKKGKKARES